MFPLSISKTWLLGVGRSRACACLLRTGCEIARAGPRPAVLPSTASSCICHLIKFHNFFFFISLLRHCFTPYFVFNSVAPPQDLQITDPGLLGSLDIEWKPPPHVETFTECTVKYRLEYRNTGDRDWKVRQKHGLILLNPGYCSAFSSCIGLCLDFK